jgi:hypothetical protein
MTDLAHYEGLERLPGVPFPAYTSLELLPVAGNIATRFDQARRFFSSTLAVEPQAGLVVLTAADWPRYAALPLFGVTHYDYPRRMVVTAAQPSTFWRPMVELIGAMSEQLMQELQTVYGRPDESIDLTPHVDLWITHDLGHACHLHAGYWFPRRWLMEYFADLCSYTYVATREPAQLAALETFPLVARGIDPGRFPYRGLADFEAHYGKDSMSFENYLWYHGFLYQAAGDEYRAAGVQALQRLWQACVIAGVGEATDAELAELLRAAQPHLARLIEAWGDLGPSARA